MVARNSRGRQKIEIRRIENQNHLRVTFSKRKKGVFTKASELCTLCGAEMAVIVFSPTSGKVYSFGHPDLDMVIGKFLNNQSDSPARRSLKAYRYACAEESNLKLMELRRTMEAQKSFVSELNKYREGRPQNWWDVPVAELGLQRLEELRTLLAQLKPVVGMQAGKLETLHKMLQDPRALQEDLTRQNQDFALAPRDMPGV